MLVYERTEKYATVLTYVVSAAWHGFYPGYYLTFLSGAIFTFTARVVRRHIRNYFMESKEAKLLYDITTFAVTHFVLAYITFPFVLLEFWPCIVLYHILALLLIPRFVPKSQHKTPSSKSTITSTLREATYNSKLRFILDFNVELTAPKNKGKLEYSRCWLCSALGNAVKDN
nr:unnamed protein product [Callosobruchus analis]